MRLTATETRPGQVAGSGPLLSISARAGNASRSPLREVMPSFVNTLRKCHSTVRALMIQLGADFWVGSSLQSETGYLLLLGREVIARVLSSLADCLARRPQLMEGTFGERQHPDFSEHVVGAAELVSCIHAAVLATQPLTVEQVRTGVLGPERSPAEAFDGLAIVLFRCLAVADKRLATRKDAPCPSRFRSTWWLSASRSRASAANGVVTSPNGRFDQLWERPRSEKNSSAPSLACRDNDRACS